MKIKAKIFGKDSFYIEKCKQSDLPIPVAKGDVIVCCINPDASTTLINAHRITDIEADGTIRIECINKCPKVECSYLFLYEHELTRVKVDNTVTESQRLGGTTISPLSL